MCLYTGCVVVLCGTPLPGPDGASPAAPWHYNIHQEEETGYELDWDGWRLNIVEEWKRQYPDILEDFKQVTESLHNLYKLENDLFEP